MKERKVADLFVAEFRELVQEIVLDTLAKVVNDPDAGLELNEDFKAELRRLLAEAEDGRETTPAEQVAKKLGLTW